MSQGTEGMAHSPGLISRIVLGLGAAACFAMVAAMVVSHRSADVGQSTPAWIARMAGALSAIDEAVLANLRHASDTASDTVKFENPFDRTEVFEFPAGTRPEEARAKVADILLQRAQEREPE